MTPPPAAEAEFKNLKTFEDWKDKLSSMLKEGKALARREPPPSDSVILAFTDRLRTFRRLSPASIPETKELDALTFEAADAIRADAVEDRLRALESAEDDLLTLAKDLQRRETQDREVLASMRMDALKAALPKVRDAVQAAVDLKDVIGDLSDEDLSASDKELLAIVKKALDGLNKLEEAVKDIVLT